MPNVKLLFNHKLLGADFKKNKAWFERRDEGVRQDHAQNPTQGEEAPHASTEIEVSFDFMIGADGAHSAVRYHLMKYTRMSYQQEYIETLWCEFHMDPSATNDYQISPNHLHIWPGGEFMFIAIHLNTVLACQNLCRAGQGSFILGGLLQQELPWYSRQAHLRG
jgi:kynurenine 3-monooxygenase